MSFLSLLPFVGLDAQRVKVVGEDRGVILVAPRPRYDPATGISSCAIEYDIHSSMGRWRGEICSVMVSYGTLWRVRLDFPSLRLHPTPAMCSLDATGSLSLRLISRTRFFGSLTNFNAGICNQLLSRAIRKHALQSPIALAESRNVDILTFPVP